jgi:SET domain-containing protein
MAERDSNRATPPAGRTAARRPRRQAPPTPVIVAPDKTKLTLPRIERRQSSLHGWGVFALQPITKNRRIIAYEGERITHKESLARERRYLEQGSIWCFRLNHRWVVDGAVGGNDARFINHSCTPNCYAQIVEGIIWIRAARNIRRGEELTYNYYTEGTGEIPCLCRPACTNRL